VFLGDQTPATADELDENNPVTDQETIPEPTPVENLTEPENIDSPVDGGAPIDTPPVEIITP